MANPALARGALDKPAKGDGLRERRTRRRDVVKRETDAKADVRKRDKRCRWPHCENCRRFKPRLEVAHLDAKGYGGDHGTRSTSDRMILLDYITHQGGLQSLEQHGKRIVMLTARGTWGPCEFWAQDPRDGTWYLVARERAPFVYERE